MNPSYESVAKVLGLLAPADRHWMMSRLGGVRRLRLAGLLDGAPPGGHTPALDAPRRSTPPSAQTDGDLSALVDEIERVPIDELLALWRGAHTGLLRCFIAMHPWRCADALRQLIGGAAAAPPMTDVPAELRKAVLESVASAARRTRRDGTA